MMLTRVLEPEVMNSPEEAADYDSMDHAEVNRRFVDDFLAAAGTRGKNLRSATVLDLGTGTAQIPIELCRRSEYRVVAVDAAAAMLEVARRNVERAGLSERIALQRVDAKRLPFRDGEFRLVMSNSIVHHIPQPRDVLAEAVRVLASGGLVFFRDLMRPASDAELARLVKKYAGDANEHQRKMFGDSLHAALTVEEMQSLVAELDFEPQTVAATSDRHWTWAALCNRIATRA
jgi:ubiquinone/menaquinone biosynthesis C-methylase UbiE